MNAPNKKVFLSHSSADVALATEVRNLLIIGCGVSTNDILVSSLPGNGIPAGTPSFVNYLKKRLENAEIVVLLLSENFFASQYCLCELGATWALGKIYFPLVVPPLSKSELGATLEVAQAGEITSKQYLDQLPDRIHSTVGTRVGVDAWGAQLDVFLAGIGDVIKSLPTPKIVPADKLKEAQEKYQGAITKILEKDKVTALLKQQIADLEKCKDKDEVNAVARKYSSADEEFERLCEEAKEILKKLQHATRLALYWDIRGEGYKPTDQDEWDAVRSAVDVQEVYDPQGEIYCSLNLEHPRVLKAQEALYSLRNFLTDSKSNAFLKRYEIDYQFPASLMNKEFWRKSLVCV